MMRIYFVLLLLFCVTASTFSQASSERLLRKGVSLHERGQYNEAIKYYEEALKINPKSMSAIYEQSLSYLYLKDYENALKFSTRIINANFQPLYVDAVCVKSAALSELGQIDQAIKLLSDALAQYGEEYLLLYNLGYSYFKKENYKDAITNLAKAIEVDPTHADAFLLYAYSLGDSEQWLQSFLSLHFFMLLEPNSARSKDAFQEMYDIIDQTLPPDSPSLGMEDGVDRTKLYNYLQRIKPKDESPENKYKFFEQASQSIFYTLTKIQETRDENNISDNNLIWTFFVPIYSEIYAAGHIETYCRYVSSCYFPESMKWWSKNSSKVDNFILWFEEGQGSSYNNDEADFGDDSDLDEEDSKPTHPTEKSVP